MKKNVSMYSRDLDLGNKINSAVKNALTIRIKKGGQLKSLIEKPAVDVWKPESI